MFQFGCLVVLGFKATLTAKVMSWWSVTHMFPDFLTPVLRQLFFPKPPTPFLTCFCRGKRSKYDRKKVCLKWGIDLTTTRSWVRHAHHWATHVGQTSLEFFGMVKSSILKPLSILVWKSNYERVGQYTRSVSGWRLSFKYYSYVDVSSWCLTVCRCYVYYHLVECPFNFCCECWDICVYSLQKTWWVDLWMNQSSIFCIVFLVLEI